MPLGMRCAGRAVFARAAGACVLNLAQQADLSTPDAVAGRCPFSFALRASAVYNARKNATQVTMSILQDNTSSAAMERLDSVVDRLCHPESLDKVWHCSARGMAMPSLDRLNEIMDRLRAALFPGYFGAARVWRESMRHHLAANLDSVYRLLAEQIQRGIRDGSIVNVDSKATAQVIISLMVGANRTRVLTPYALPELYDETLDFVSRSIRKN